MSKSSDAFRTISEVSNVLDTPAHVLRFWEGKFSQLKPVKRAGGRRYYRPDDLDLLAGIKKLLHDDGMTIKGAQKLLRKQGVKHVTGLGATILAMDAQDDPKVVEEIAAPVETPKETPEPTPEVHVDITNVVTMPKVEEAPKDPALSLNLAPAATEPAATASNIPEDPAGSDSKAPPRLFHLLRKTSNEDLSKHADAIAPLLARMQTLRDRVAAR